MPERSAGFIELRAAREQDNEFFYLGYSTFPGKEPTKKSLANNKLYKPHKFYPNEDGSMTVEWQQPNFGGNREERQQNFYKYASGIVASQLAEATDSDVVFSHELELVRLQLTEVKYTNDSDIFKVTRTRLGSMSLFASNVAVEAAEIEQKVA